MVKSSRKSSYFQVFKKFRQIIKMLIYRISSTSWSSRMTIITMTL